jgi:hypothetical protein
MRRVLWLLVAVVLSGCMSPLVRHNGDRTGTADAADEASADAAPKVVRGGDPDNDTLRMLEDGYARVGFSYFDAANADTGDVLERARAVHADIAVVYSAKAGDSHTGVASYWVKLKPPVFGVHMQDLPTGRRTGSGTRTGAYVTAVVKDSPAARAGIVRGDIIRKIGEVEVNDMAALYDAVSKFAGQKVTVELWREHQVMQKEVQLNQSR